jgi:hypothetical protein
MWRRIEMTAVAVLVALVFAGPAAADVQLVNALKQLGKGVDDMSANISTATSDADAELLANVTRQALDGGLKQDRPKIEIRASAGFCRVTIETPKWKLWSEARAGKIVDHGATIN